MLNLIDNSTSHTPSEPHIIVDDFVAPKCAGFIEILYQDDDILLINKPSGLLSLSGKNPLNWDSVHYRLVNGQKGLTAAFAEAKLPHRLDLGTSGIMIVGLNAKASKHLNIQFQARTIQKRYVAMLEGRLAVSEGEITAPIAKDKLLFPRVKICQATGKVAVSEYSGHPILGCDLYKSAQSEYMAGRLQLHASDLYFEHPTTSEKYSY